MERIRKIAFVINSTKSGGSALAAELTALAEASGATAFPVTDFPLHKGYLDDADLCCVIGGDGTLLAVVDEAVRTQTPVLGVNLGKLGFLAWISPEQAREQFQAILAGKFRIVHRELLECRNARGQSALALNDVVIKSRAPRLASLIVKADDHLVNEYFGDGVIFSTATGSTAYNLSAGGPIIHPGARVIAITAICPHTLSARSIILGQQSKIEVELRDRDRDVSIMMDGKLQPCGREEFPLTIQSFGQSLPLLQQEDYSHYRLVRTKLHWIGDTE